MIKIGPAGIDTKIMLAPLSGCSDLSFRLISREHGARFCFYEMVDANSLIYASRSSKNADMLQCHEDDAPIAAQLIGSDPETMLRAAKRLLERVRPVFLDINAACPVKKVIGKKAGAYLLKEPAKLSAITKTLASSLDIPVTVKMRIGYETPDIRSIVATAKACEKSGASALFVHGRTKTQAYSGCVDYASIRAIKDAVGIPVVGSGNILSVRLAKKMFDETACDGILVARGSFGNPWIFEDIENYLKKGEAPEERGIGVRKKALAKHISYIEKYKRLNVEGKVGVMRKVAVWYTRGFPNAARLRDRLCRTKRYEELMRLIDGL
ncbi:MAG: tRNA dihydrouridine synthase DusB [Candidatus Omnitrophica bacterium]|nr:tRNA dihydrouridine synthase DusB [Candidatus Omnitrophota bacterium]